MALLRKYSAVETPMHKHTIGVPANGDVPPAVAGRPRTGKPAGHSLGASASPRPLGPLATRTASGRARATVGSSDPGRGHAQTQATQVPGMLSASDRPGRVHSAGGAATECKLTRDNNAQAPRAESPATPSGWSVIQSAGMLSEVRLPCQGGPRPGSAQLCWCLIEVVYGQ